MRQIGPHPELRRMTTKKEHQNPTTLAITRLKKKIKTAGAESQTMNVPEKKLKASLPTIPEVVWQQPQKLSKRDPPYDNPTKDLNTHTVKTTEKAETLYAPNKMPRMSETSPEHNQKKTGINTGQCPNSFQTTMNQADTLTGTSQRNRDDITPSPLTVSSFICEHLVRDVESIQTYLPLNASVTLKQKERQCSVCP